MSLAEVVATFGAAAKSALNNPAIEGEPEEQLRTPLVALVKNLAKLSKLAGQEVQLVGETKLSDLMVRPDFAVTRKGALIGFIEVKAPGKGADPTKFKDKHDKDQWAKLKVLPNLIYTDGNAFSLWQAGKSALPVVRLDGDVESSGKKLRAPPELQALFDAFLAWDPVPPRTPQQLAETSARLCRLLRDEVTEQLDRKAPGLTGLREDWRKLLFPHATDAEFADGYAQAVTFGLLMARARLIPLDGGIERAAKALRKSNSLIGSALRLLTEEADENTRSTPRCGPSRRSSAWWIGTASAGASRRRCSTSTNCSALWATTPRARTIGAAARPGSASAGREIVNLPAHATMVPNAAAMAGASGGRAPAASPQVFNFNIVTPSPQAFAASQGQMAAVLARAAAQGGRNG